MRLSNPVNARFLSNLNAARRAIGTILDNDLFPNTLVFSVSPDAVTESGGMQDVTVTATLSSSSSMSLPSGTHSGQYCAWDEGQAPAATALHPEDYTLVGHADDTQCVTNAQYLGMMRSTDFTLGLTLVNDMMEEGDETIIVGTGRFTFLEHVVPATLTIIDDDRSSNRIRLSITPVAVAENGGGQTVTVTATLEGSTARTEATVVTVTVGRGLQHGGLGHGLHGGVGLHGEDPDGW